MALRHMTIARMGEYRPPVRPVGEGGKTGRMKLLHNGPGNGLSGGGGMNAKGTGGGIKVDQKMKPMQRGLRKAKYQANKLNAMKMADRARQAEKRNNPQNTVGGRPMAKHPVGRFQYGYNQWGFINAQGKVNWTSTAPKKGDPVVGWNQVAPYLTQKGAMTKMPQRVAAPTGADYFKDSIYQRTAAGQKSDLDAALAAWKFAKQQIEQDYGQTDEAGNRIAYGSQQRDLMNSLMQQRSQTNMGLSGANLSGSGVARQALQNLDTSFIGDLGKINMAGDNKILEGLAGARDANANYNTSLANEAAVARDRWAATNPGMAIPAAKKGVYKDPVTGATMYAPPSGIPQTFTPKPVKKKTKTKVKPKLTAIPQIVK